MDALTLAATVYSPPVSEAGWRLEELFSGSALRYYGYARNALAAGLKAARIGKGDAVLVPEYVCRDLLSGVAAAGARVEFYAQAPDLSPAAPFSRWPAAKAVIAVDYFGFPQDLAPFRDWAERGGGLVIEDAAHALFSRDASGALCGSRGDLSLLSIRKTIPLPNGAALVAPKGKDLPAQEPFDAPDSGRYLARQAYRVFGGRVGARAALAGLQALRRARRAVSGVSVPGSPDDAETVLPPQDKPCGQLAVPLRGVDPAAEVARRRGLYAVVSQALAGTGVEPVFSALPDGAAPYGFPYRGPAEALHRAENALNDLGLFSLGWPDLPDAVAPRAPEHYKNVRLAHFLW